MKNLVFALALASLLLASCTSRHVARTYSQSLYDRVMHSGKIRCGYLVYAPVCIKDPNTGKLSGMAVEVTELVAQHLGLKVDWTEEVGTTSMIEGLLTDRYDMVPCTIWPNASRARQVDFSRPMCFSPICAYVRKGDRRFLGSLALIDSPQVKIATMDGEMNELIARTDFPKAQRVIVPQLAGFSQLPLNVAMGKADLTFLEPCLAYLFLKDNPGTLESIPIEPPLRIFPGCIMFKKSESEFKTMLNTALDELINSGTLNRIISKYEPFPNAIYRVAHPYLEPEK